MDKEIIISQFHQLYYHGGMWANATKWMGVLAQKCPLDFWIYQEIIYELKPDLIIETGTYHGGSALFMAHMCDLIGNGEIVTVDTTVFGPLPKHKRITYLNGMSTNPGILNLIEQMANKAKTVIVILDSDHTRDNVYAELCNYARFVTPKSYLIVEDTNVNGHPIEWSLGPGPTEAINDFLPNHPEFEIDKTCEKFLMTQNPGGYLRKR
jgi:cephalosporin hydroxylase